MQTAAFLRRGGFELRFAGFLRRFDGSEPGTWQWGRWILGQIQWKIIYEVWGAVLVALHKPSETAPFFYSQLGTLGEAPSTTGLGGYAETEVKIN